MSSDRIGRYLEELSRELRRRGVTDGRAIDEARAHLADAVRQGTTHGLSAEDAEREALERFGSPETVAATFPRSSRHAVELAVFIVAVLMGLAIAFMDSRPNWDDTGVTVVAMLGSAGLCGLVAPRRAWRWALAIGLWIPLHAVTTALTIAPSGSGTAVQSLAMFVVLVFPLAGAYGGVLLRRAIDAARRPSHA